MGHPPWEDNPYPDDEKSDPGPQGPALPDGLELPDEHHPLDEISRSDLEQMRDDQLRELALVAATEGKKTLRNQIYAEVDSRGIEFSVGFTQEVDVTHDVPPELEDKIDIEGRDSRLDQLNMALNLYEEEQ